MAKGIKSSNAMWATLVKAPKVTDGDGNYINVAVENLIGKQVNVRGQGQEILALFPACGLVKVAERWHTLGAVAGAPVFTKEYELSEALPLPSNAKFYLVTDKIVAAAKQAGRDTADLLTPINAIVTTTNIDCTGLERH